VIVNCYVECHYAECRYGDSRGAKGIPIFNLFYVTALVKKETAVFEQKYIFFFALAHFKEKDRSKDISETNLKL
jgi:hypothetical protein